VTDGQTELP